MNPNKEPLERACRILCRHNNIPTDMWKAYAKTYSAAHFALGIAMQSFAKTVYREIRTKLNR